MRKLIFRLLKIYTIILAIIAGLAFIIMLSGGFSAGGLVGIGVLMEIGMPILMASVIIQSIGLLILFNMIANLQEPKE